MAKSHYFCSANGSRGSKSFQKTGKPVSYLGCRGEVSGYVVIGDKIKRRPSAESHRQHYKITGIAVINAFTGDKSRIRHKRWLRKLTLLILKQVCYQKTKLKKN